MTERVYRASLRSMGIWFGAVACTAIAAFLGLRVDSPNTGLITLGLTFAAYAILARFVSGANWLDARSALLLAWGGGMVAWGPMMAAQLERLSHAHLVQEGLVRATIQQQILPYACIALAGIMTAKLLYLVTGNSVVFTRTLLATMVAIVMMVFPQFGESSGPAAIVAWNAIVAASLCVWAISRAAKPTTACRHCGKDVKELSSPVCTSCGHELHQASPRRDALSVLASAAAPVGSVVSQTIASGSLLPRRNPFL
ncbi:MAG: hypothetical protein SFZ23_02920 [Planctomycetota bacterium]|nr:hypothetical protein [Planctomycetota bacterium]